MHGHLHALDRFHWLLVSHQLTGDFGVGGSGDDRLAIEAGVATPRPVHLQRSAHPSALVDGKPWLPGGL